MRSGILKIVESAARTTSGQSDSQKIKLDGLQPSKLGIVVNASVVTGTTPSATFEVEWSHDGTTFGAADGTADTFAAITAASAKAKQVTVKGPFWRLKWTITGTTPSFTFSAVAVEVP